MHELIRFTLVWLCATFLITALSVREVKCEGIEAPQAEDLEPETTIAAKSAEDQEKKEGKSILLPGGGRRPVVPQSSNGTRDSQLLSLLAARRRQLLNERLATHINTLTSLTQKPNRNGTTFAQLELRDSNSSIVKRITYGDNVTKDTTPVLKLETTDGSKEIIRQDIKPHEIRQIFVPKPYQDTKSRSGFINNRRKDSLNTTLSNRNLSSEENITTGILYVTPNDEKLEGPEQEVILDPEEEFQVDESNHGLYLLNYSDTSIVTQGLSDNATSAFVETKENIISNNSNFHSNITYEDKVSESDEDRDVIIIKLNYTEPNDTHIVAESNATKPSKIANNEKDKTNNTLFMTDEIYNHFRPLETELPVEEMAPFIHFGQKLSGPVINDNLTNSPSLSASTKSVNLVFSPFEKRKFNSRYSVTEKYRNTSAGEDEFNEDMDVSVVKNIIEKNKVRNTVKGPAPARSVGLVNAYRKYSSTLPTSRSPNISQLNTTETISVTSSPNERQKEITVQQHTTLRPNTTIPRNYTRGYLNLRRRPSRLTASSTENAASPILNGTTEKASTLVYTAVVTSVSITSSMKGQNATDNLGSAGEDSILESKAVGIGNDSVIVNDALSANPDRTSNTEPVRQLRHKIRIRTTTETFNDTSSSTPFVFVHKPTEHPEIHNRFAGEYYQTSSTTTPGYVDGNETLVNEESKARVADRFSNLYLYGQTLDTHKTGNVTTQRPQINKRRRRPTTTSTTASAITTLTTKNAVFPTNQVTSPSPAKIDTTAIEATTQNSFVVTPKTSSQYIFKQIQPNVNPNNESTVNILNKTIEITGNTDQKNDVPNTRNEEVVIEAEKTYTASYVLAGLGFLPVIAIVVFLVRNILRKKTKEIDTDYEGYFDDGDIKKESPITPVARPPISPPSKPDQKWEFPRNKLRLQTLLGQGNFGQVWKAEADDLTGHDGLTRLVAVKSIKETASQKEKQELLHEIYIMQKIGTHPNVVTLLACCTEQEPYLLIMEYVMCGKLLTYLRERRSRPDRFSGSGALTSRDLTVFAYCVARGMDYIASKGIVHRDLAARNVLVDHNKLCKIADFGMSRELSGDDRSRPQRHALPVRWMAPEALLYNVYNHETDVWAYGILLWEIVTLGSTPYAAMSGREVLSAVTEGYRLERPPHCKPQLYRAMHACWHADPAQRPSFASIKGQLAELLDNEPVEGNYVDLDSFYQESSVYSDPSAIIHDDDGLSAEYDRERRCFRDIVPGSYDNRAFTYRDEELRSKFSMNTQRMGGFGIRDIAFNERNFSSDTNFNERNFNNDKNFNERNFADEFTDRGFGADKNFNDRSFPEKNFGAEKIFSADQNFNFNHDPNFNERKDGKLSTSSFHRERERENPLVSRNSFSGFRRLGTRDTHFQKMTDGRNNRVSEFECDI